MSVLRPAYTITQEHVRLSAATPARAQRMDLRGVPVIHPHDHEYFEITLVVGGRALHRTSGGEEALATGSVIIVPPGPVHAFESLRGFRVVNVYYLAEWLLDDLRVLWSEPGFSRLFLNAFLFPQSAGSMIQRVELERVELEICLAELESLERETDAAAPSQLFVKASLLKVLALVCRGQRDAADADVYRPEVWAALRWVEDAIGNGETFEVQQLAESLGRSPDHIGRLFRQATGQTLSAYYQQRRTRQAQRLLLDPQYTITEVAHRVGYCDAAHLCHQFKGRLGMTPLEYRRAYVPAGVAD